MKMNYFLWAFLMLMASVITGNAQTYSLKNISAEQFASGGTDVWGFERHDVSAGVYSTFTMYGDSSLAVNYYDPYLTERYSLYPIMGSPASGTTFTTKRNARFSSKSEYVYIAAEYPSGTSVTGTEGTTGLIYGTNYPDSLSGYEVYSKTIGTNVNAAVTFTAPAEGYYKVNMKVIREDLWNSIGPMKICQFFRYSGEGSAYSMGQDFSYGYTKNIDTWATANAAIYTQTLAKLPEYPYVVSRSNSKPFRGLPTNSASSYFYFYAKQGDKISFEADARSTGNGESTDRGAYSRTKWLDLTITATDATTAKADAKFVDPYTNDPALMDSLNHLMDKADSIMNNSIYSSTSRAALSLIYADIDTRLNDGVVKTMEIPSLITKLQNAINVCLASQGGMKVRYTFDNVSGTTVSDLSGQGNNGVMVNNAAIKTLGKYHVLNLGSSNGYLDMGTAIGSVVQSMSDYTISAYYRIDPSVNFTGSGYDIFSLSTSASSSQTAGQYLYYRTTTQAVATSKGGWGSEVSLKVGSAAAKGLWQHLVVQQKDTLCTIYVNGVVVKTGKLQNPSSYITSPTTSNFLGRACFSGDKYLPNTFLYDFRLYNYAIKADSISKWAGVVSDLEHETNYGTNGDYKQLDSLVTVYRATLQSATVGTAAGTYTQSSYDAFSSAIASAQAILDNRVYSQLYIDAAVSTLITANNTFLGSVNVTTNTLPVGKFLIKLVDTYYITNPGATLLANGTNLTVANGGLSTTLAKDSTQAFKLSLVTSLTPARYSVFSCVNESGVYRHLTENIQYQSSWGNPGGGTTSSDDNWRTFNVLYNGTNYAIQDAGSSASKGYWQYDATNKKLVNGSTTASFVFKFIPFTISTGVNNILENKIRVFALDKAIEVFAEQQSSVTVYSISGVQIAKKSVLGSQSIPVQPGLYFVKVTGASSAVVKVLVK